MTEKPDLNHIAEYLRSFAVSLDTLTLDPDNARVHDERNITTIERSLTEFGQLLPILQDDAGVVRVGNGRLIAARNLAWEWIACPRMSDLTPEQIQLFATMDNKSAELASWDWQKLSDQFRSYAQKGMELDLTGFADFEIAPLLEAEWTPPDVSDDDFDPNDPDALRPFTIKVTSVQKKAIESAIERASKITEHKEPGQLLAHVCESFMGTLEDG